MLVVLQILTSCGQKKAQYKDADAIDAALQTASVAKETEKRCFLGFTFGMTENEVVAFADSLKDAGKLYLNGSSYYYDFTQSQGLQISMSFRPKFYNGALYEMEYGLADKFLRSTGNEYVFMMSAFKDSENSQGFKSFIDEREQGNTVYYCVKGNLIVTFKRKLIGESVMVYTNAPVAAKAEQEHTQELETKSNDSYSEF